MSSPIAHHSSNRPTVNINQQDVNTPEQGQLIRAETSFIGSIDRRYTPYIDRHQEDDIGRHQWATNNRHHHQRIDRHPREIIGRQTPRYDPTYFAAESNKGFMTVSDNKDAYVFLYPFGWQVYKDVIEPLERVSVNLIPTSKQTIKDFGPPKEIAETLVKKTYYQFKFTAQARNYTRHALGIITVFNGKFYTLTTGANERRWEKMKDRLHTVVDSFKITV
ncbi:hypothetical protein N665_0178s0024 [Sinapis alba]|nr:hypothetical protein N665_0178s0024 [Sinapis alba]